MPIKVLGLASTEVMLLNIDTTAKKRVRAKLIERAYDIRDLARRMSPHDEGNLEKAIKVQGDVIGARDELGRFTHVEVEVFIDFDDPLPERPGKTVGDYAYYIHEGQQPKGSWPLGLESDKKQQANPDIVVGGGFLDRAAAHFDKSIEADLVDIVRNL